LHDSYAQILIVQSSGSLRVVSSRWICFSLIILLGVLSSAISAVIAALILVEAVALLKLDRRSEVAAVVLARVAIGLRLA